ncbi:MAG TPA: OsmC family protein [Euzebyales bacterium]|nr:OsmC family protein [Euzebyales bacterium]
MADKTLLAVWSGGYRSQVTVRDFDILADEPESVGGTDDGPTPTELFLASLATCFTMAVAHASRKCDITLEQLAVRVEADYEGNRFAWIRVQVTTDLADADAEQLIERAKAYCFVSNTLIEPPRIEYAVGGA